VEYHVVEGFVVAHFQIVFADVKLFFSQVFTMRSDSGKYFIQHSVHGGSLRELHVERLDQIV
jgi:hypothetical protein